MSETASENSITTQRTEPKGKTTPISEDAHFRTWEIQRTENRRAASERQADTAVNILKYAMRLRDSGLSTIPIRADGSKQPALCSWKEYQRRLPTRGELANWFGNASQRGIAVIGGKVSGNLEIIDIDWPSLIPEWLRLIEGQAPGLLTQLPQVKTPSGGLHVFYRCARITGNTKLAERHFQAIAEAEGAREREGEWSTFKTSIETRGEGGYVITAGSAPSCHPSGKPYVLINGDLEAIPEIPVNARELALNCARKFDERPPEVPSLQERQSHYGPHGLRPGDDFNHRGDARSILEKHGWRYMRKGPRGELWRRPGVDHTSATLFPDGSLYVFSSNAHPFNHNRRYDKFSIFALLEHAGDWEAAARDLAKQGYGCKRHSR